MQNSFEVAQCTLLNKLVSLGPLYFKNVEQVLVMVLLPKIWERRRARQKDINATTQDFIMMLVYLLFVCFFPSLFVCCFSSSPPCKGTIDGTSYYITLKKKEGETRYLDS